MTGQIFGAHELSKWLKVLFRFGRKGLIYWCAGGHWPPVGREETLLAVRQSGSIAEKQFAMAAAIGTHGTVGVAGLCQHSLPSTVLVDASSSSPLEINKREMLYTLMTFPQWPSKTTAPLKLLCPGWDERRVPTAQQRKGNTESTVCPLLQGQPTGGGDNQVFMWHGAYRGQPRYCPHSTLPYPGLIVPLDPTHGHVVKPPQPRVFCLFFFLASTSRNEPWPVSQWMSSLKQIDEATDLMCNLLIAFFPGTCSCLDILLAGL